MIDIYDYDDDEMLGAYDTIRYDRPSVYLTCSKMLTGSQLSPLTHSLLRLTS